MTPVGCLLCMWGRSGSVASWQLAASEWLQDQPSVSGGPETEILVLRLRSLLVATFIRKINQTNLRLPVDIQYFLHD